jgi:uncharacterized damage-inducible protein DinB
MGAWGYGRKNSIPMPNAQRPILFSSVFFVSSVLSVVKKEEKMAFTAGDLIEAVQKSRKYFLKHLEGIRDDQWDWKPFPECKSIRETLVHLIVDDWAALQSFQTKEEPDYEGLSNQTASETSGASLEQIRTILTDSHERLCAYLNATFVNSPLDTEVTLWGSTTKLGRALAYLPSEDFYHAGQVAFIRMATDPQWDYYASIYS